jgi:Fe-S oxidoreductase/nitrate reductase gamma subunit
MHPTDSFLTLSIYSVLVVVSIIFFCYSLYKRFKILKFSTAEPVNRWDNPAGRALAVLKFFIGQGKILDKRFLGAGIMHAFIFWGFLAVAINTIHLTAGGFFPGFYLPFFESGSWTGDFYTIFRDIFEVLVLVMVLYALLRRLILRPKRITPSAEAILVLLLIAVLMITDFTLGGAKYAAGIQEELSPVSKMFSTLIIASQTNAINLIHDISWWVHIVALFFFLNLLPVSKHFHVITSLFNVFLKRFDYGALRYIDLEKAENFGVSQIEQSTWKDILDIYTCTECGRCQDVCPAFNTGKLLNPKQININSRNHLYEEKTPFLLNLAAKNGNGEFSGKKFVGEIIEEEMLWACTTCRACEEACPLFIEYVDRIVDMRRYLVLEEGKMAPELANAFKNMENQGNPWGKASDSRDEWSNGLQVPEIKENTEVLYWIGCSGSFDDRNVQVTKAMIKILNKAGVDYGILGKKESCTGDPARRAGNEYLFQMLASANIERLNALNFKTIVTQCPHCLNTLKNEYPQMGGNYQVVHHSQFIEKLISDGKIKLSTNGSEKITFHDPCYLGRHNNIYQEPRSSITAGGSELLEMKKSKNDSFCCGAGGAQMWKEEEKGDDAVRRVRYGHAIETGANIIGTGCPFCMTMMSDARKELNGTLEVKDIAEIIASQLI